MSVVESSVPHVMISYQWDAQKVMAKVKDNLNHAGFKVWMDVEHMSKSHSCLSVCKMTVFFFFNENSSSLGKSTIHGLSRQLTPM
jgi:uncharacterized protein (DUF302 family)